MGGGRPRGPGGFSVLLTQIASSFSFVCEFIGELHYVSGASRLHDNLYEIAVQHEVQHVCGLYMNIYIDMYIWMRNNVLPATHVSYTTQRRTPVQP